MPRSPVLAALAAVVGPLLVASAARADLLVSSFATDQVLRYNDAGQFVGVFASGGGLDGPYGLAIGPGGDLFVVSSYTDQVLRYDGTTGAYKAVAGSGGGLDQPTFLLVVAAVPEPASALLAGVGAAGLAARWLRRGR